MSPLDVVILLKITLYSPGEINQFLLAKNLFISQSEISKSLQRSRYAGLVVGKYKVMRAALMDFLQYGIKYAFPQQPGAIVRGIPTAHSMSPLSEEIQSDIAYIWPSPKGNMRGQAIIPLFPSVVDAIQLDHELHELLAMVDAIRVGRSRERQLAIQLLNKRIIE